MGIAAELTIAKAVGVPVDLIEKLPTGVLRNSSCEATWGAHRTGCRVTCEGAAE